MSQRWGQVRIIGRVGGLGDWDVAKNRLLHSLGECAGLLDRGGDWSDAMRGTLASLCQATGVSRVWIFQLIERGENHVVQDHIFEHASEPRWAHLRQNRFRLFKTPFDSPAYREVIDRRLKGLHCVHRPTRMADCSLRRNLMGQGIQSMLTTPIMVGGQWWGTLGLDDCERDVDWSEDDIAYLRVVASLIAGSIQRERQSTLARQFAVMERSTGGGMWELDLTSHRLWCSDSLFTMLGYPPPYAQMNSRRLARHLEPEDRNTVMDALRACLRGDTPGFRMDVRAKRLNGDPLWLELITDVTAHAAGLGSPLRMAGLVLEAGERKNRERELNRAALTDSLTALPNRRAFQEAVSPLLRDHPRRGALMMIDIDHFKRINDTLGHGAGDEVLRALGRLLRAVVREGDRVARIGGEEFAIFLGREGQDGREVAERLRRAAEDLTLVVTDLNNKPVPIQITLSIGLALAKGDTRGGSGLDGLLTRADRALYEAKGAGRNRVVVEDEAPRDRTKNRSGR